MVQRRDSTYVTNRQGNTSRIGDMLQYLKWHNLEDGHTDARLVMMYQISHDRMTVSKRETFITPVALQKYSLSVISDPIM